MGAKSCDDGCCTCVGFPVGEDEVRPIGQGWMCDACYNRRMVDRKEHLRVKMRERLRHSSLRVNYMENSAVNEGE